MKGISTKFALWFIIIVMFEILTLVNMGKLTKYKNQRVNNLAPLQSLTATNPHYCLAMYSKYCTSTLMTGGVKTCEIIKSTDGYKCNYYGSSFTTSLLSNDPTTNVFVKQKGYKLNLLFYYKF